VTPRTPVSSSSALAARLARRLAVVVVVAAALQGLYWWGGHRLVAYEYARHYGAFLYNLIPTPGRPLADYLARADTVFLTVQAAWVGLVTVLLAAPLLEPATARVHEACLRFGGACVRHRGAFLIGGALAVGSATAAVGWFALRHFPNSGDEYCYLYQAQTFAAGRFSNPPHPLQAFFPTSHIIERDGRLFSVFPPGWPLVIAAASRVGIAAWALGPLLSAGLFVLTFRLAERLTGDGATAALASVTMAATSYFLLTGASYFSHTACAFFVVGAMVAMLRMADRGGMPSAVLAGLLAGLAMITRYYTPILCLLPLAIVLWRERRWRVEYMWAAAGLLPPLIFLLAYDHALTGSALLLSKVGVASYDQIWFAPGAWHRGGEIMLAHLSDLIYWTPAMLFIAYVAGLRRTPLGSRLGAVSAGFACLAIGLYPYINRGGNEYGPRFYFDGFPLLVVGAAAWLFGPARYGDRTRGGRRIVYLFFASALVYAPLAAGQIRASHALVVDRLDLTRQVASAHLRHALVFVTTPVGADYPMPETDLIRNGIAFDGPVLYALDRGAADRELIDDYPDRACYTYRYDPATRSGTLSPCH
jgi:hypothetical protein